MQMQKRIRGKACVQEEKCTTRGITCNKRGKACNKRKSVQKEERHTTRCKAYKITKRTRGKPYQREENESQ